MTPSRSRALRLALVAALFVGLFLIGHYSGAAQWLSLPYLRARSAAAGPVGGLLFGLAIILAVLLHLPAAPFVLAALLCYGRLAGSAISYGAALLAISISYGLARAAGGQLLRVPRPSTSDTVLPTDRPLWRRLLAHLDDRPVRTVFFLRAVFALAPPLNFALALTGLRFRHYLLGSAIGLLVPLAVVALSVEWLAARVLGPTP